MSTDIRTGTVEGTGAAINIELGFVPDYVEVYNADDAGGLAPTVKWWNGMADGSGLKTLKSVDSGTTGNASSAAIVAGGISEYAGDSTPGAQKRQGFTIGTDADLNVNGETLFYTAVRGETRG